MAKTINEFDFKLLPHDQVFDKFFNQTQGVAGLCKELLQDIEGIAPLGELKEKTTSGETVTLYFPNGEVLDYVTYNIKDDKPYAFNLRFWSKDRALLYVVARVDKNGIVHVGATLSDAVNHDDGITMHYHENYEEIHFSDKLFMFDHYVAYQSFQTEGLRPEEVKTIDYGTALTRDFNIVKQGHRITRYYDATKVKRDGMFPSGSGNHHYRAQLVEKLVEKLGKKQSAFYNEYDVVDESMNYYIAKHKKMFDDYVRDERPFEDVVDFPNTPNINGMC